MRLSRQWPTTGPRIGSLLVHQQALSAASLRLALRSQQVTHLPLGRQLEQMGLVSEAVVLRALSRQAGVSYRVTVSGHATAKESGELGDVIALVNELSGRRLTGRVVALGEVEVVQ